MGIKKIKQILGMSTLSIGLATGILSGAVGAQSGSIDTTGPDSSNAIEYTIKKDVEVKNDNNLSASNSNEQSSKSGTVKIEDNTTGGNGETGSASTSSGFTASVSVDNSGIGSAASIIADINADTNTPDGSIDHTGPDSSNKVTTKSDTQIDVHNDNHLNVVNTNNQVATSGDARVSDNTTGGDAITGDVSNTSTTSVTFEVSN